MGKARFRYLPHTADVAFVAYGKTFREALENSALAMLGVMFDIGEIKKADCSVKTMRITERAANDADLLWFTLQRIVSKVDEKRLKAFGFKVNRITKGKKVSVLHGCVFYKPVKEYVALLDVKAVTPHGLEVKKTKSGWSARVLLDV